MSKDLKRMVAEIRGALDAYPREQLQEILAWVFKEYVVEGGAAPAQGALAMLDARSELEGLPFAELVTWLQLHLDVPELAALEVQGARVSLRAGGRTIPIEVAARAPEPPIAAPAPSAPAAAPTVAANPIAANPIAPTPPVAAPAPPVAAAAPATAAPSSAPTTTAKPEEKADDKKDDAASRFSWLEVD